ncbi:MAG: DUF1287 domain-containing protein [Erysipelothrix sp.]|jgi:uncharacterized protein YijF (DUF1287 family)|nr:DUF1287 domain-containing protein [Erysipelothrix sp.]
MKRKKIRLKRLVGVVLFVIIIGYGLVTFNIIPKRYYSNADFNIETYISENDKDQDGLDDQKDILQSVREYIATKPQYKSKYYGTGYPDDVYGVCTDVVAYGLLGAGYDLRILLDEHVKANRDLYNIEIVDKNIDFRRVVNLRVFFEHNAQSLTTDIQKIDEWQGGDIVVFRGHIGIVSDRRNKKGIPYMIHHGSPYQFSYEEDVLENYDDIIGHYRISSTSKLAQP